MHVTQKSVPLVLAVILAGCTVLQQDHTIDWSANQLYEAANEDMKGSAYSSATEYYTKLLARYPYGQLAQQSMLDLAYSYYRAGEPEKALEQLDDFIRTYPDHPYIDYALYMKGVVEYEKNISFFDRMMPTNLSQTDPKALKSAFDAFSELVQRFPNSEYAEDARFRMIFLRNLLGEHELEVAKHYMSRGAFVAAVNRAEYVLEQYETTPSAPYALAILVRGYQELGETQLSADAKRVLDVNFADQLNDPEIVKFLQGDYRDRPSIWDRFFEKPKI